MAILVAQHQMLDMVMKNLGLMQIMPLAQMQQQQHITTQVLVVLVVITLLAPAIQQIQDMVQVDIML